MQPDCTTSKRLSRSEPLQKRLWTSPLELTLKTQRRARRRQLKLDDDANHCCSHCSGCDGTVMAYIIVRGISGGIASVIQPMSALAAGDLGAAIPFRGQKTELGSIAEAIQVFKEALIAKKASDEAAAKEADAKTRRAEVLDQLTSALKLTFRL